MSMSSLAITIVLFVTVALIGLAAVWWYATRVKRELDDTSGVVAGARGVIELSPESVERLRELTSEPILLKQSEEGVRVQIEHRPMMPLRAFLGRDAAATLQEVAGEVSERYGVKWVVLVDAGDPERVTVKRLA
jgi:hypothetical protein